MDDSNHSRYHIDPFGLKDWEYGHENRSLDLTAGEPPSSHRTVPQCNQTDFERHRRTRSVKLATGASRSRHVDGVDPETCQFREPNHRKKRSTNLCALCRGKLGVIMHPHFNLRSWKALHGKFAKMKNHDICRRCWRGIMNAAINSQLNQGVRQ